MEFNDGGTAAVEIGDRQGTSTGSTCRPARSCRGGAAGPAAPIGPGQGCTGNFSAGTPKSPAVNGVQVPGSPPIDSTASVGNGDLYFGAGNAASPVDGGYYAYSLNGTEAWNQVVTNPATDERPRRRRRRRRSRSPTADRWWRADRWAK